MRLKKTKNRTSSGNHSILNVGITVQEPGFTDAGAPLLGAHNIKSVSAAKRRRQRNGLPVRLWCNPALISASATTGLEALRIISSGPQRKETTKRPLNMRKLEPGL